MSSDPATTGRLQDIVNELFERFGSAFGAAGGFELRNIIAALPVVERAHPQEAGNEELKRLSDALDVLEGHCGADDRHAAYAVCGAARAYLDARVAALSVPPSSPQKGE